MFHILAFFLISVGATIIGAICGIGGGIIIKPALDAFGILSVPVISFLSGTTVLGMTTYNFVCSRLGGDNTVDMRRTTAMALGAAVGGFAGQAIFDFLCGFLPNEELVGAIQAGLLFAMLAVSLIYTLNKSKVKGRNVQNLLLCGFCGLFLGIISSFIGIGGGPINMVFLYFFFSMRAKAAAQNSLYIILFSQAASLIKCFVTQTVPQFDWLILAVMIVGAIGGVTIGRRINKHLSDKAVNNLYIALMVVIMLVNAFNIFQFLA